jgi:hypothetical protein
LRIIVSRDGKGKSIIRVFVRVQTLRALSLSTFLLAAATPRKQDCSELLNELDDAKNNYSVWLVGWLNGWMDGWMDGAMLIVQLIIRFGTAFNKTDGI